MRGGGTAFSAGLLCEMTAFRIMSDFECGPSDSGLAHVARMAIAGPGWTLHRTDVAVHLLAARARISHVCLQAGPPSSVSPGVLLAYRWTIRAGHRLMLAAGCTLIYPTDTGSKPQPVAGARRVQLPGGLGAHDDFLHARWRRWRCAQRGSNPLSHACDHRPNHWLALH